MEKATTIRVSQGTLEMLENLRDKTNARSLDEAIQMLIRAQRHAVVAEAYGLDKGRVGSFTEEDRGEDRS